MRVNFLSTGIFVATTGVFMFVTTTDLVRFAHEILGVCFAVAIVTGAAGAFGLGRTIAVRLAKEGADVVVNDVVEKPYNLSVGRSY